MIWVSLSGLRRSKENQVCGYLEFAIAYHFIVVIVGVCFNYKSIIPGFVDLEGVTNLDTGRVPQLNDVVSISMLAFYSRVEKLVNRYW